MVQSKPIPKWVWILISTILAIGFAGMIWTIYQSGGGEQASEESSSLTWLLLIGVITVVTGLVMLFKKGVGNALIWVGLGMILFSLMWSEFPILWRDLSAMTGGTPVVKTGVPWQDVEVPASKAVKVPIYGYHYCVDNEDADGVFATVKAVGVGTRSAHLIIRSTTGKKETVGLIKLNRKVSKERFELPKGCEALYL